MHDSLGAFSFFLSLRSAVTALYDEVRGVGRSHQMNNLDPSPDLLRPYTYTFLSLKSAGGGATQSEARR